MASPQLSPRQTPHLGFDAEAAGPNWGGTASRKTWDNMSLASESPYVACAPLEPEKHPLQGPYLGGRPADEFADPKLKILNEAGEPWVQKESHHIPGYTGFVRGKQHIAGRTFGEATRRAMNNDFQPTPSTHSRVPLPPRNSKEADERYFVPGYTGFVRGKQHIQGRTFGDATRRALNRGVRENVSTSPIPSAPQANAKLDVSDNSTSSFVPGYTGHIPNSRERFGHTYGKTVTDATTDFKNKSLGGQVAASFARPGARNRLTINNSRF